MTSLMTPRRLIRERATGVFAGPINIATNSSFLVRVNANVRGGVLHDRFFDAALALSGANPRFKVALSTVLSAATHYNVTVASRSFHIGSRAAGSRKRMKIARRVARIGATRAARLI